jgi:hypothetical protein
LPMKSLIGETAKQILFGDGSVGCPNQGLFTDTNSCHFWANLVL